MDIRFVDEFGNQVGESVRLPGNYFVTPYEIPPSEPFPAVGTFRLVSREFDEGDEDAGCQVCNNRSVQVLFTSVCQRAGSTAAAATALQKLCDWVASDITLFPIGNELMTWSPDALNAFFADITVSSPLFNHITNRLDEVNVGWVRAWERLHTLLPDNLKHFATDVEHLRFLQHEDVTGSLEWMQSNGEMHLFDEYSNLLPGELIAMNYYTTSNGYQINFWLRNRDGDAVAPRASSNWSDAHGFIYQHHLNNAFNKLPHLSLNSYLRMEERTQVEIDALTNGTIKLYPNYISTAKSAKSAFLEPDNDPIFDDPSTFLRKVIYVIENASSGKIIDLEPFSRFPLEEEALVASGKRLEIVSSSQQPFPIPSRAQYPGLPLSEYNELIERILADWATNTNITIDGVQVNPNAIPLADYSSGNYTPEQLNAAQRVLTFRVRLID